jgi:hypothetical protein
MTAVVAGPRAASILAALHVAIRTGMGPEAVIANEVPLVFTRVDCIAIGAEVFGFEIKSDRDSCARLDMQATEYSRTFDRCVLVAGMRLAEKAMRRIPEWWGVMLALPHGTGGALVVPHRTAGPNPDFSPRDALNLLWCDELREALESRGLARGVRGKSAVVMRDRLAHSVPAEDVRLIVRDALRARADWRPMSQKTAA